MKSGVGNQNKKAYLLLLSKEASNKDTRLKSQLLMSFTDDDDESKGVVKIWIEYGFFGYQRADLNIQKANFPENSLIYVNQATVSLVKGGEKAIYCDYVICAQIVPMANPDPVINFDTCVPKDNGVVIFCPVYNKSNGLYRGLTKKLGMTTLRGDMKENFFSYGYSKEKSSILYCYMKSSLPNIFKCTVFKKHVSLLLDLNENKVKSSGLLFFLPSTLDRKEDFIQWREHVHLHPVDFSIDNLMEISGLPNINPALLESSQQRKKVLTGYYKIMKKITEISNQNLVCNSHAYLSAGGKTDPDNEFLWIDDSFKTSTNQFQLSY